MQDVISTDEILPMIQAVMKELFDLDAARVQPDARLIEDLGLDSIDAIDLAAKMEEATGQAFDEASLRKLRTIRDVIAVLKVMLEAPAQRERIPA